jgi:hypothetical protein
MNAALWIKLASIAVHAEELLETATVDGPAATFDVAAIKGLLADREVRAFLDAPKNAVLLPRKRSAR